jgi:cation diffusion facilitator CzcD-associated flavoprotein CzcO
MSDIKDAIIVGAGLGGLCAAIKLSQAGMDDFVILEAGDRVGGTWRANSYPGCQCDVPVALYQFSFAPGFHWSRLFPNNYELQAYCEQLTDQFALRDRLSCNARVSEARWDGDAALWRVKTEDGRAFGAKALIAALGQLDRPQWPAIAGLERFAGARMHSAAWDHAVALKGKRIAVIGSAASAVQLIPEVAKEAGHLSVFQRTPNWLIPRNDRAITDEEKALLMTEPAIAMKLGAMQREGIFDNADYFFWQAFQWTPQGRAAYERIARDHLEAQIPDVELRKKLTPDYPIGCKRILICDDFYPTLMRDNVTLVTDAISRVDEAGIVTKDGAHHACDVLICATGFETTQWNWSMDVHDANGATLKEAWKDGPEAHLGVSVAGFPNFFMLYGPNTNLGHNSITTMIEHQSAFIVSALKGLAQRQGKAMSPKPAAQKRFNADVQARLANTVWADPQCASWYKNAAGKITQNWGSHVRDYIDALSTIAWEEYEIV